MDELLVSLVFQNNCLWDKKSVDFKNVPKKNLAWKKIGENCGMSATDAEGHFKSMRAKYIREKKEDSRCASGSEAPPKKKEWHLKDQLRFLDDVIAPRKTFSSAQLQGKKMPVLHINKELREEESNATATQFFDFDSSLCENTELRAYSEELNVICPQPESDMIVMPILSGPSSTPLNSPNSNPMSYCSTSSASLTSPNPNPIFPSSSIVKAKKRKTDPILSVECKQLSDVAAALAAPIIIQEPTSKNAFDGDDRQTRQFCQYLSTRLNDLPREHRRALERKILSDLDD